jgi:hypothetical protein
MRGRWVSALIWQRLSRQTCEYVIFVKQRFGAFFKLRVHFNAVDRTDDFALRFVVVPDALCT